MFEFNQHPLLSIATDLFGSSKHAYNHNEYSTAAGHTGHDNHDKYSADAGHTEHDYYSTLGSDSSSEEDDSEKSTILLSTKKIKQWLSPSK